MVRNSQKKQFFYLASGLLVLTAGCGGNENAKESEAKTDSIVQPMVVEKGSPVDTAAITAKYAAEKAKAKGTYKTKPKRQDNREVLIEPSPLIESYRVESSKPNEQAKFPGGENAFYDFVSNNIKYPKEALKHKVEGTVYADIYFDEEGKVIKVVCTAEHVGYGMEDEVQRVVMTSPRWMPAKGGGHAVKSTITLPITFKLK